MAKQAKIYNVASLSELMLTMSSTKAFGVLTEAARYSRDAAEAEVEVKEGMVLMGRANGARADAEVVSAQAHAAAARAECDARDQRLEAEKEQLAYYDTALLLLGRAPALIAASFDRAILGATPQQPLVLCSKPWVFGRSPKRSKLV